MKYRNILEVLVNMMTRHSKDAAQITYKEVPEEEK